jgi:hypothetical protein
MVITTILESKDLSHFSTDELISSLLTHETRLHITDESISNAFKCAELNGVHLSTFRCIAYAHIPSELRKKLDDISEKCIFTGYNETSEAYRIYNPISKKLILNRDVKFLENQFWNESENQQMDSQNPLLPSYENKENSGQQVPQTALPRLQVQRRSENSQDDSTSSRDSSYDIQNQRTRSLREIHQQLDDIEQHNIFA